MGWVDGASPYGGASVVTYPVPSSHLLSRPYIPIFRPAIAPSPSPVAPPYLLEGKRSGAGRRGAVMAVVSSNDGGCRWNQNNVDEDNWIGCECCGASRKVDECAGVCLLDGTGAGANKNKWVIFCG